jgi:hypothetical protein
VYLDVRYLGFDDAIHEMLNMWMGRGMENGKEDGGERWKEDRPKGHACFCYRSI